MDKFDGLANGSGMFYPTGFMVALIPVRQDADDAATELRNMLFEDVREFSPQEILDHVDQIKANQSFFSRLSVAFSESELPANMALQQVKLGCNTVMVRVDDEAAVQRARALINKHNPRMLAYWGKWRVTQYS
jgi:hypothetical protein